MFMPDEAFDKLCVHWNGEHLGTAEAVLRNDVHRKYPWFSQALHSGFRFEADLGAGQDLGRIDVIGWRDGQQRARLSTLWQDNLDSATPTPPLHLMKRTTAVSDLRFKLSGLRMYTDLTDQISRFRPNRLATTLDWGCGCGRVTTHFILNAEGTEVFGVDIDGESIDWCKSALLPGHFERIDPFPPARFTDGMFDLIVSCSVFTHLGRNEQRAWLQEMARVLAPGGLFLASTHGRFAYITGQGNRSRFKSLRGLFGVPPKLKELDGIRDAHTDRALDGVAPKGYYRTVHQSRDYTLSEWSKYFMIVDYIECGLNGHQDLVVMRSG